MQQKSPNDADAPRYGVNKKVDPCGADASTHFLPLSTSPTFQCIACDPAHGFVFSHTLAYVINIGIILQFASFSFSAVGGSADCPSMHGADSCTAAGRAERSFSLNLFGFSLNLPSALTVVCLLLCAFANSRHLASGARWSRARRLQSTVLGALAFCMCTWQSGEWAIAAASCSLPLAPPSYPLNATFELPDRMAQRALGACAIDTGSTRATPAEAEANRLAKFIWALWLPSVQFYLDPQNASALTSAPLIYQPAGEGRLSCAVVGEMLFSVASRGAHCDDGAAANHSSEQTVHAAPQLAEPGRPCARTAAYLPGGTAAAFAKVGFFECVCEQTRACVARSASDVSVVATQLRHSYTLMSLLMMTLAIGSVLVSHAAPRRLRCGIGAMATSAAALAERAMTSHALLALAVALLLEVAVEALLSVSVGHYYDAIQGELLPLFSTVIQREKQLEGTLGSVANRTGDRAASTGGGDGNVTAPSVEAEQLRLQTAVTSAELALDALRAVSVAMILAAIVQPMAFCAALVSNARSHMRNLDAILSQDYASVDDTVELADMSAVDAATADAATRAVDAATADAVTRAVDAATADATTADAQPETANRPLAPCLRRAWFDDEEEAAEDEASSLTTRKAEEVEAEAAERRAVEALQKALGSVAPAALLGFPKFAGQAISCLFMGSFLVAGVLAVLYTAIALLITNATARRSAWPVIASIVITSTVAVCTLLGKQIVGTCLVSTRAGRGIAIRRPCLYAWYTT